MEKLDILNALKERYGSPRYALFLEVGNAVGYPTNRIDALAMAMWRSLGLEIHGFEIKMSRGDWLREIRQPFKAEEMFRYCDRWWLVVADEKILKDGELPPNWGLLVSRGSSLIAKVQAKGLTPQSPDREFVASILRKVHPTNKFEIAHEQRPKTTIEELASAQRSLSSTLSNVDRRLHHLKYIVGELRRQLACPDESPAEKSA